MQIDDSDCNSNRNTMHCKEISMHLGIKHDRCYLSKKCNDNVKLHLNIDDDSDDLKMMHCIATRKSMTNVRDARRTTIEISKVTTKEKDT